ncbi:hypothetical protein CHS0354_004813, partial [Potamilus streckersoni]
MRRGHIGQNGLRVHTPVAMELRGGTGHVNSIPITIMGMIVQVQQMKLDTVFLESAQLMEIGEPGRCGQFAVKRVVEEYNQETESACFQTTSPEDQTALVMERLPVYATHSYAQ